MFDEFSVILVNFDSDFINEKKERIHWTNDIKFIKPDSENILNEFLLITANFKFSLDEFKAMFTEKELNLNFVLTNSGFIKLSELTDLNIVKIFSYDELYKCGINFPHRFSHYCFIPKKRNWLNQLQCFISYIHIRRSPLTDLRPSLFATKKLKRNFITKKLMQLLKIR